MLIAKTHTSRHCRLCKIELYIGAGYYDLGKGKYVCEHCVNLIMNYLITCYAIQNNKVN